MSPRAIPGERSCETCGARLESHLLRFCSRDCFTAWRRTHPVRRPEHSALIKDLIARGEMPPPPRAAGPFKYPADLREAMHLVKTGTPIAGLTPEQRELFRAYNRENQRIVKQRKRERREAEREALSSICPQSTD